MPSFESRTGRDRYFEALDREIQELVDPLTGLLAEGFSRNVSCPVCNDAKSESLFIKRGYSFVRCCSCGHIFVNPQVKPELVWSAYKDSEANLLWTEVLLNPENQKWQLPYFDDVLALMERYGEKGRLLDVGCSVGLFIQQAIQQGWNAEGLELGDRAYHHCIESGLTVQQKKLEECDFPEHTFAAVTAFGLLEHLNDPRAFLETVRSLLDTNGIFVAIVPNTYSLAGMVLREKIPTFDGRNHLQYFSIESLRQLLEQCGYEIRHLDTVLTALPNLLKYIQFRDPYGPDDTNSYVPLGIKNEVLDGLVEKWILHNNLGLRIRVICQPGKEPEVRS